MSTLFIVGTPIGNLQDITLRAIDILQSVDIIACEDTRHSRKLLNTHDIHKRLISCHSYNEKFVAARISSFMHEGKDIAFISDAGTPGISDPGRSLVRHIRKEGFKIVPIPGPSSITAILSVSGFSGKRVIFEGFLSPKSGKRKTQLKDLLKTSDSFILYESPFRVLKLLLDIVEIEALNGDSRKLLCGRELTKSYEEIIEGSAGEIHDTLAKYSQIKGEFVLLVSSRIKST